MRERLRWEKELLGLYLSEHPMGEVAEQVGRYVNAYSGDLKDESLDGQRIVVGGIVTGVRPIVTKRNDTMAIVTIEDLQGTIEVVVFPRLYETTRATWRDGAILLIAGPRGQPDRPARGGGVDPRRPRPGLGRRGRARAGGVRPGRRRGRPRVAWPAGQRPEREWRTATAAACHGRWSRSAPVSRRSRSPRAPVPCDGEPPAVVFVSPLRVDVEAASPASGAISRPAADRPAEPVSAYVEADSVAALAPDRDQEPAVPDEARDRIVAAATADAPLDAGPDAILHVRFAGSAASERVVSAMELVKTLLRDRPGATRVVIHVPASGAGEALPMELRRGVAYDAELLAEVHRRLGDGLVELRLAQA